MEILKFLFSNFRKTFLFLIWVVCGITSICLGSAGALGIAGFITICYGVYRIFTID